MLGSLKRKVALATAATGLGMAGTAVAASPAFAYHLTYYSGGTPVPTGTAYTASLTPGSGAIEFTNSSGAVYAKCTGSSLSGVTTTITGATTGSPAAGINVTGPTGAGNAFSTCSITGSSITVTPNFSTPWLIIPTAGTASPFTGEIENVNVLLQCSASSSATFTGTLSTGGEEVNATGGSEIVLSNAQSLSKTATTGTGCPTIPTTVGVTGSYTLTSVGGNPISSTNNLWENNN